MPSRQVGSLAVAALFAMFAVFLYCARDESGAWRPEFYCRFSLNSDCPAGTTRPTVHIGTDPRGKRSLEIASKKTNATNEVARHILFFFQSLLSRFSAGHEEKRGPQPSSKISPSHGSTSNEVTDPATGIALPRTKRFSKSELTCLGVGVRAKSIAVAKVNVYTVGLYVDKGARGALKKYAGSDPAALRKDVSLFKVLGQAGFTKYLHLVFARDVGAVKVVDALTSVKGVGEDALSSFSTMMLDAVGKTIGRGETISLGWEGKDKMVVLVRGKPAGTVVDSVLPKAVFDLYLGSSPVSPEAKAAFAEGVPAFVAG